ncbi:phosphatidylinositol-glycan biosynthesis class F protein [Babesia caballi]|uniref:Phosphatidylinositol-glycan biosynthesis class F protein n=1 Tax=Babesia caballi TaxID=5871 RepID=A0AAV4LQ24_BABCB|nr:phosphatidylinositol-glycan biosynthesis class F protein [Babesia caballi]
MGIRLLKRAYRISGNLGNGVLGEHPNESPGYAKVNTFERFSREADVRTYNNHCLKRYMWCDIASAITDVYLAYYIVRQVDITGRSKAMVVEFAFWFRTFFVLKIFLHAFVIPYFAFSGSVRKVHEYVLSVTCRNVMPMTLSDDNTKSDGIDSALEAKTILMYERAKKGKFLCFTFGVVCAAALLLTIDHEPYGLLDTTLMTLWFCVVSYVTLVHFVYFPEASFFGIQEQPKAPTIFQHPRIGYLVASYTMLMVAGWYLGNYVSLLDWDEPYIFFPTPNFIGLCIGHLAASLSAAIILAM